MNVGKAGLRQLVIERLVGDRGVKQRMEAAVEIRQGFDALARTGRRQRQTQAKRRDGPLAPTKLCVFAASVEQRFRKHPLELISDHAKLSVIHLGLLSLYPKQHIQEEFRMDHRRCTKNRVIKITLQLVGPIRPQKWLKNRPSRPH